MKKITVIFMAFLLTLTVGQVAFARSNVALNLGYTGINAKTTNVSDLGSVVGTPTYNYDAFKIGVSGAYYFTKDFSLAGDFSAVIFKLTEETTVGLFSAGLFARYDVLKMGVTTLGLQAGIMDSFTTQDDTVNYFFIAFGAYANFNVAPNLNLYVDAKIPVISLFKEKPDDFKVFFYNAKLGISYDITKNVFLGVEAEINNCNFNGALNKKTSIVGDLTRKTTALDFTVGAKVGYKF